MTFETALKNLFDQWIDMPTGYKQKWKSYRSKWVNKRSPVAKLKMEEMLIAAGYKKNESWSK